MTRITEESAPSVNDWTTNTTLDEIAARLKAASRIALLTHSRPDGDAIGSTLAVARALQQIGQDARPVYMGNWAPRFDPIIGHTPVIYDDGSCWDESPLADADAVLILDTGSWNQLSEASDWLMSRADIAMICDHHAHGDPDVADRLYIDTTAAAACEIEAPLCATLLGIESIADLPQDIADALFVGLATDTGWFRHSNVTARTFRMAGSLLEAGANQERLFEMIEQNDRPARLALMQRALASVQYVDNERIAIMSLSQRDFLDTGADLGDAGGFAEMPRAIGTVRASAIIIETEPGRTKISFRSKGGDDPVDVNLIAQRLGGGGHAHAAGAKLAMNLDEARAAVIRALTPDAG